MDQFIPIFPLELVVYPGDDLNLNIFEPRYRQLIQDCDATKIQFGIPAVVNKAIGDLGTLMELVEIVNVRPTGEMDVRTRGLAVFRVERLAGEFPGKMYSGARVNYPVNQRLGDPQLMQEVLDAAKRLHRILNVDKKLGKAGEELMSYAVAHHVGLSLSEEYELLGLLEERERQEYLRRHLERVLPVVNEIEALKEKAKLNGHFKKLSGFEL